MTTPDPIPLLPPLPDPEGRPCPACLRWYRQGRLRREAIQPLPPHPPLLRENNTRCCHDCESADLVMALQLVPEWIMGRVAVANDRQEQLRAPGLPLGLVYHRFMRPNAPGALEKHHKWLDEWVPDDQPTSVD